MQAMNSRKDHLDGLAIGTLLAPVLSVLGAGLILDEPLGWREALALSGTVLAVALAVGVRDKPP